MAMTRSRPDGDDRSTAAAARWPLPVRYALLPALAVVATTAVLLVVTRTLLVEDLSRRTLLRVEHRAATLARELADALDARVLQVQWLARSPRLQGQPPAERVRAELESLTGASGQFVWLALVSTAGQVVAATQGRLEGQSIADDPAFRRARTAGWIGVVDAAPSGQRTTPRLDIGEPVHDAQGRLLGVLVAQVDAGGIERLLEAATGPAAVAREFGLQAHLLSRADGRSVLNTAPPPVLPAAPGPAGGVRDADGRSHFAASRDLGGHAGAALPWRVLVLQDRDVALQPVQVVTRSMLALATLAALALGLAGYLLARRLLRPWDPVFDSVLARLQAAPQPRSMAEGVDAIARELAAAPAPPGRETLVGRLARGARELKRVIDHLPVGVALVDRDLRVEYLNPSYTRLLGWTTEQVRGRLAAEFLFDAVERGEFLRLFDQLAEPPGEVAARFDALRPDGGRVAVQWQLVPLVDAEGRLDGAIAVVQDVRAERIARARADALAGRLRALADAAVDDLLATLDREGRVLEWSRGAERLSGRAASEAIGRPLAELVDAGDAVAGWLEQALRAGHCAVAAASGTADARPRSLEGSVYALGLAPGSARYGVILRDVTEQRELHHALERSEARLRLAIEAAHIGTWDVDLDTPEPRLAWSPGYEKVFGVTAERLPRTVAQTFEAVHPDDRSALRRAVRRALRRDAPLSVEFRVAHPQGSRWHAIHGRALRSGGRARRLVGIGMDVTARKQAELALRRSREQLERVVQTMAEGLALIDARGHYTLANRAVLRILGIGAADIVGQHFERVPWQRAWPGGGELPREAHPFERLRSGEAEVRGLVVAIERPDAQRRVVSLNAFPLHDDAGGFAGAVITCNDITERHRAEQALADSRARLSAIVDGASDAIVSIDAAGRITLFNPAAERIFGVPAARMIGQPVRQLVPEPAQHAHDAQLAAFLRCAVARRPMGAGPVQARHADGRAVELEASISKAVVHGQPVLTAILRDVTQRVAHERAIEATRSELMQLTQRLLAQEKQTTRRLAQALHDELGQTLSALRLHWEALPAPVGPPASLQHGRLRTLIEAANRQIRNVLGDLRPPLLDDRGLAAALDNELRRQRPVDERPALRLEVAARLADHRWPADVEYAAFMIADRARGAGQRAATCPGVEHRRASRRRRRRDAAGDPRRRRRRRAGVDLQPARAPGAGRHARARTGHRRDADGARRGGPWHHRRACLDPCR